MQWLLNLPTVLWRRLLLILQGLGSLIMLIGTGIGALFGKGGTVGSRIAAALTAPASQRRAFAVLRLFQPNLVLGTQIITAYPNNGSAVVTRQADVIDVLSRDDDFGVVYGTRMEVITGGENFFLGMQDTPRYTRDVSNMRLVVRRDDVPAIVTPVTAEAAAIPDIVAASTQPAFSPHRVQSPASTRFWKPLSPGASRWNTLPVVEST